MRLVISVDGEGVQKVELEYTTQEEMRQVHSLFLALKPQIDALDGAAKTVGAREKEGGSPNH